VADDAGPARRSHSQKERKAYFTAKNAKGAKELAENKESSKLEIRGNNLK